MGKFGFTEILIIIFILLIFFGGKRLPAIFRAAGESIRNFKSGIDEGKRESDDKKE